MRNTNNSEEGKIAIKRITWCAPHVTPSLAEEILLNTITTEGIELAFFAFPTIIRGKLIADMESFDY